MEKRTSSPYPRIDRPVLAVVGVALVIGTLLLLWRERAHDWRWYQYDFRRIVTQRFGPEKAASVPAGLQQVWVPELGRADRCTTCHQGLSWKGFEGAEQPYRTHPIEPLKTHPIARFGCTSCHGGQGWAVDTAAAHGEVTHWNEPLLGSALGESYTLATDKSALMQMQCNQCHRYERETKGAPAINLAKRIVRERGCRACHIINGFGGSIGPDLTNEGEKAPEQYDFSRLSGQKTAFAWHVAHFKEPRATSADTVMPNFNFSTEQAQALAMLMLSWRYPVKAATYVAGTPRVDARTEAEVKAEEEMRHGPGAWFVQTGCFVCHSVSALRVKSPADIGPDLSGAVEDVQKRFGVTIDEFLRNPTGTMAVVLSRQIILTPEQKAVAIQKLQQAFDIHRKERAAAGPAAAHQGKD